ncbi:MAG TPA: helix-turn-helix domain-containing protein [Acidimicrobiales bacterium]|nr:helix-turn-helix domain-containing protein [Acidimicrobiales bacterium]
MAEQSKTVDAALRLLARLAESNGDASATSLARALGISRTAAARLLATLEVHGLARRTDAGWGPGLGLLALAAGVEPLLRGLARAELEQLAARFRETAVLTVRECDDAVAVDHVVGGTRVVQIHYPTGTRHPLTAGASGRALLPGSLEDGVVFTTGELEPGVTGVAAPILDAAGRPVASLGLVAPEHRFPDRAEVAAAVRAAASRVSANLARHHAGQHRPAPPEAAPPPGSGPPPAGRPPRARGGGADAALPTGR